MMIAVLAGDSLADTNVTLIDGSVVLEERAEEVVVLWHMQSRVILWSL